MATPAEDLSFVLDILKLGATVVSSGGAALGLGYWISKQFRESEERSATALKVGLDAQEKVNRERHRENTASLASLRDEATQHREKVIAILAKAGLWFSNGNH